ncbi:hypothetical protein BXZ70DRAFT_947969 [Cristinia sonorae]|uniref:Protein kinase domain-containing protein n=1 Tax=Cristinia sonorae TaxID=1940300 RepID=A0A8K0XMY8_9AGAR|nr:hypothetical protein BXZ70DRAFT_947969 [Cristinia sonorae]
MDSEDINFTLSGSGISNFVSHKPLESEDIRAAIETELSGRVTLDSTQILRRLNTETIETELVDNVLQGFEERNSGPISALKTLVRNEEADEKAVYPHLRNILADITSFGSGTYSRNRAVKDSFLEIRPLASQGLIPKGSDKTKVPQTLAQTADYARLHMSSRPFQLFTVALVICGSKFVVAIFDRDGVTVSTDYDMWEDTAIFVRVVLQITSRLSPIQLGTYPSVQELEANSTLHAQILRKSKAFHCPRQLRPCPETPFSTTNKVPWVTDQWVVKTAGRALWESNSYLEIVKGVRAALIGHHDLLNQGILHRDISPGNILLSVEPSPTPGEEGFLTDLEFARIQTIVTQDVREHSQRDGSVVHSTHSKWHDAKRGAVMTGTVQFMAIELVEAMTDDNVIEHQVHHDVESIIWVLAYAIGRRLINDNSKADDKVKKQISKFFARAWDCGSLDAIVTAKSALAPLKLPKLIRPLLPGPILSALEQLILLMHRQMSHEVQIRQVKRKKLNPLSLPLQGGPLTHNDILRILDECVKEFGSSTKDGGLE